MTFFFFPPFPLFCPPQQRNKGSEMRRTEIGEGRREKVAPFPGLEFGGTLARVLGSLLSDEERGLWRRKVFPFFKSEPPLTPPRPLQASLCSLLRRCMLSSSGRRRRSFVVRKQRRLFLKKGWRGEKTLLWRPESFFPSLASASSSSLHVPFIIWRKSRRGEGEESLFFFPPFFVRFVRAPPPPPKDH